MDSPDTNSLPAEDLDPQDAAIALFDSLVGRHGDIGAALRAASIRYPEQAGFLADYALTSDSMRDFEPSEALERIEAQILHRADALIVSHNSPALFAGIVATAARRGIDLLQLSDLLELSRSVLVKLDRRLIDPATIPASVTAALAEQFSTTGDALRRYLAGPPSMAAEASYRSRKAPSIAGASGAVDREAFANALDAAVKSGEMTPSQAARWRS